MKSMSGAQVPFLAATRLNSACSFQHEILGGGDSNFLGAIISKVWHFWGAHVWGALIWGAQVSL